MNTREKYSVFLVFTGLILAFLPLTGNRSLTARPEKILGFAADNGTYVTVDQVAGYIVNEDTTLHLIDLRPQEEYLEVSLPGATNIPYNELLDRDPATFLGEGNIRNIFYSNDDFDANFAIIVAAGLGYNNCYVMRGGLNEWFKTVVNSEFRGDRISARENALFETRVKATRLFNEINSLPDSLKSKFLNASRFDPKKLDGGCE